MQLPSFTTIIRATGYGIVVAGLLAAALQWRSGSGDAPANASAAGHNPLAAELARCRSIGAAAEHDPSCEAAWAENRRRFLGARPATGQE